MRTRLILAIICGFSSMILSGLAGYYFSKPEIADAGIICVLVGILAMLTSVSCAQDDGKSKTINK